MLPYLSVSQLCCMGSRGTKNTFPMFVKTVCISVYTLVLFHIGPVYPNQLNEKFHVNLLKDVSLFNGFRFRLQHFRFILHHYAINRFHRRKIIHRRRWSRNCIDLLIWPRVAVMKFNRSTRHFMVIILFIMLSINQWNERINDPTFQWEVLQLYFARAVFDIQHRSVSSTLCLRNKCERSKCYTQKSLVI